MQTIAKAVRILSLNGMMEIKIGTHRISAKRNYPTYGPLTFAESKSTGEFVYLLADGGIVQTLDSLEFRMTIKEPKAKKVSYLVTGRDVAQLAVETGSL